MTSQFETDLASHLHFCFCLYSSARAETLNNKSKGCAHASARAGGSSWRQGPLGTWALRGKRALANDCGEERQLLVTEMYRSTPAGKSGGHAKWVDWNRWPVG